MELLKHNLVADMTGPDFVIFYILYIMVVVALCFWFIRSRDNSRKQPQMSLSLAQRPEAYQIAFFKGGLPRVGELAVFNLLQRNLIEVQKNATFGTQLVRLEGRPDAVNLPLPEKALLDWLVTPRTALHLKMALNSAKHELNISLSQICQPFKDYFVAEKLLLPPEYYKQVLNTLVVGLLLIDGLGLYKLIIALSKGHTNIGFLLLLWFGGTIFFTLICLQQRRIRYTRRGLDYESQLRLAFKQLPSLPVDSVDGAPSLNLALSFAVYELGGISGTPYVPSLQALKYPVNQVQHGVSSASSNSSALISSSGCSSSSSSSSSCGSSSGGGGCGGCGGCGSS